MKIITTGAILAAVIPTTYGKKSKTSNDFYNSKDGDRFAARWDDWSSSSGDNDDWWASSWSGKASKGSKSGGGSSFQCKSKTYYIDLDNIEDDVETSSNKFTNSYTNYKVYKSSSDVGNNSYDGIFSYTRSTVSDFSCQATGMLGLDGGPTFKNQIYFNTMCDPEASGPAKSNWITDGGITSGFGDYAMATGTVKYEISGTTGKLKFWYCLPYGMRDSWGSSASSSWDR